MTSLQVAEPEGTSVTHSLKAVFEILGWKFAEGDDKDSPFSETLAALGVTFNVSLLHGGSVSMNHTKSRRCELAQAMEQGVGNKKLSESLVKGCTKLLEPS